MWKSTTHRLAYLFVPWALLAACGGRTLGDGSGGGGGGGGSCVNVDITTYDRSCRSASDCVTISAGTICSGECFCGGATINVDGQSRYDDTVRPVDTDACSCPAGPTPECIDNTCTICTGSPNDPPGCSDDPPDATAPLCVYVDLSSYDQSCNQASDCIGITSGKI